MAADAALCHADRGTHGKLPGCRPRRPRPQKHLWFDVWKAAEGDGLRLLVDATAAFVAHHEAYAKARRRTRRPADHANHLRRIEAIVCILAHAALLPPPTGRIAVQLGNRLKGRSRYDSPVYSKTLSLLVLRRMRHHLHRSDVP